MTRKNKITYQLIILPTLITALLFAEADAKTVLVTGANRGIGLEFVRHYADAGHTVIATTRNPDSADTLNALAAVYDRIFIEELDVNDFSEIDGLAEKYSGTAIDVLVNNAGISGGSDRQHFGSIDYETFEAVMNTNVRGPLKMTEAFNAHVAASEDKKVVVVSSSEGSIGSVRSNRRPFYRASKAAVNMIMRNIALSLKEQGITVVLVNPGAVDTDMTASARGLMPLRTAELAVDEMVEITKNATMQDTAKFYHFNGTELPW